MEKPIGYGEEYHRRKHRFLLENDEFYNACAALAMQRDWKGISTEGRKVLDFGCGTGYKISLIEGAVGFDESPFAREFCAKKGLRVTGDLSSLRDGSFDCVLISHVLEHVPVPTETLDRIRALLKPGGRIIVVLPVDFFHKASLSMDENQHLYAWNLQAINNLLTSRGFRVVSNEVMPIPCHLKRTLLWLAARNIGAYDFVTSLAGRLRGTYEMRIVAQK
ncbi:MAG: class I SAM-dependent methyltransferase [Candidatus Micrarchaeota archaeon]